MSFQDDDSILGRVWRKNHLLFLCYNFSVHKLGGGKQNRAFIEVTRKWRPLISLFVNKMWRRKGLKKKFGRSWSWTSSPGPRKAPQALVGGGLDCWAPRQALVVPRSCLQSLRPSRASTISPATAYYFSVSQNIHLIYLNSVSLSTRWR